ncbi:putative RNase H-like HicB family nuclease [Pseudomonas sp. JAI115]|uniref:hypothetical protein n=1 Tax=Pseudomonas sp. JAI115 TaxID=2723061 RepID=UPI00179BDF11|nr:hypothetical protein [Pseudomonas sp. JAI115]MBB6155194.1 putative RNase H-like HicB family nuclease [Pseudomonas sp. JAI115]
MDQSARLTLPARHRCGDDQAIPAPPTQTACPACRLLPDAHTPNLVPHLPDGTHPAANDARAFSVLDSSAASCTAQARSLYSYPIHLHFERSVVRLLCPDIPEIDAVGDTLRQGLAYAMTGLNAALALYVKEGRKIPLASAPTDPALVLAPPMMTVVKIMLWNAMCEEGVNRAELARRMGCTRVAASRLVDFLLPSKIATLERALNLLGRRLTLVLEAV